MRKLFGKVGCVSSSRVSVGKVYRSRSEPFSIAFAWENCQVDIANVSGSGILLDLWSSEKRCENYLAKSAV